tara:strand:+ start:2883 stop:3101 length:219 start_codon:yes stop_codon:yes gene_type:complete
MLEQGNYLGGKFSVNLSKAQGELNEANNLISKSTPEVKELLIKFREWERTNYQKPYSTKTEEIIEDYIKVNK